MIGAQGLAGPNELAFYRGSDTLTVDRAMRLDRFGGGLPGEAFSPVLALLVAIIFVVLLLPIAVFLTAAVRFGGERRDRRLAAVRLVGADTRMIGRLAAGEAAAGALLGLLVGGALFALGRQLVPLVTLWDLSAYADDLRPAPALVAAIAVAVPVVAVLVALGSLRRVVVEPLGVTRRSVGGRRRLWWRLVLPALGLLLLYPLVGGVRAGSSRLVDLQVATGATLLLIGTVALLPWLVDLLVRRLRGGPVPWQLAVRRLQLDSATSARLVNGIAVAVAGTIGLQMLFAGIQHEFTEHVGNDRARTDVLVSTVAAAGRGDLPGSTLTAATLLAFATPAGSTDQDAPMLWLRVGDCAALAEFARLDRCRDGDVFVADACAPGRQEDVAARCADAENTDGVDPSRAGFVPGARLTVGSGRADDPGRTWTLPPSTRVVPARVDPAGWSRDVLLATPGAIDVAGLSRLRVERYVDLDRSDPDALERLRSAALSVDPLATVSTQTAVVQEQPKFANIRRGLYLGAVVTLLLIGVSMLVGTLEQLRERRRLLSMLVAVGTRRGTLSWSVWWQTAVPVAAGLALAVVFGLGLGAVLLRLVEVPLSVDWSVVGLTAGLGAAVVFLVTGLSMPVLWRLTRADGLRTE
ncbi:FtsX-like permease family protein [Micromonospora zhanjiangensis]